MDGADRTEGGVSDIPEFEPISFPEWLANQDETFEDVRCQDCGGTGQVNCECGSCGDKHTRDCRKCNGGGNVSEALTAYWVQIKRDRDKWKQFHGQEAA